MNDRKIKILLTVALVIYSIVGMVLFARADDVKTYTYDGIKKDNIVLYSMGYHPEVGNFMGYRLDNGKVAWIVLIKHVEVMPDDTDQDRPMNMVSEIRYRYATAQERLLISLKGE